MYLVMVDDQVYVVDADQLHYNGETLQLYKGDDLQAIFNRWTTAIRTEDWEADSRKYLRQYLKSKGQEEAPK